MPTQPAISDISHLIALSVAPVFLLAGVGSVLGVMAARLSRIVDRARVVEGGDWAGHGIRPAPWASPPFRREPAPQAPSPPSSPPHRPSTPLSPPRV